MWHTSPPPAPVTVVVEGDREDDVSVVEVVGHDRPSTALAARMMPLVNLTMVVFVVLPALIFPANMLIPEGEVDRTTQLALLTNPLFEPDTRNQPVGNSFDLDLSKQRRLPPL